MDQPTPRPRWLEHRAFEIALACAACAVLGIPSLWFPLAGDQGGAVSWVQQVARGFVPYRDVWEQRPPLLYYSYLLTWLAGIRDMSVVRVPDLIIQVATAGALAALARRRFGRGAGLLAGLFYGYCYFGKADFTHTSQPDGLYGLPIAAALLLLDGRTAFSRRRLFAAGAVFGVAIVAKYPAAFAAPVLMAAVLPQALAGDWRARALEWLRRGVWMGLGSTVPFALLLASMAAMGALGDYWESTVTFNLIHAGLGAQYQGVWPWVRESISLVLLRREVVAPLLLLPLARVDRRGLWLGLTWLACGSAMIVTQHKFFSYHFLVLEPPLALLSAAAVHGLWRRMRTEARPLRQRVVWAIALLAALAAGFRSARTWVASVETAWLMSRDEAVRMRVYELLVHPYTGFSLPDLMAAADELRARARPGDRLYTFGGATLYYVSGLEPSTRFLLENAILVPGHPAWWDEQFARQLRERPPAFISVAQYEGMPEYTGRPGSPESHLHLHPELAAQLSRMEPILRRETLVLYGLPDRVRRSAEP